ncbi:hypothetical protein C3942_00780 [Solimonas fluminis]|uniref:Antitermination protein Q n=1 Tax=Solimonas fluminis TaxID=2086571 RepID=A0A2S5TKH1_9GAMM|nr:hypothetical protein [Solimonas fluminis]PPE75463.1 hypothetical protein C3942_00780 [Solimonas fluminis]
MTETEIERLENRLENWARWAKADGHERARCASAEGAYVAPAADEDRLVRSSACPVDARDARFIEEALVSLPSKADRLFIVYVYLLRRYPGEIARKLKFDVDHYEALKQRTLRRLADRIAAASSVRLIARGKPIWAGLAK